MTVKKYLVLSLVVLSLFIIPVSAASYNWGDALIFSDEDVSLTEVFTDPWYPVSGQWYRLVSVNPNNGNVYIDVVVQCKDSMIYDPVSGSSYMVIESDDGNWGLFTFPFLTDEDGYGSFPAYSAVFPAEPVNPPVDNAVTSGFYVVISMIGNILDSMLTPSGDLFPLTVILCVGIAVSLLMLAIYALNKWIWGL